MKRHALSAVCGAFFVLLCAAACQPSGRSPLSEWTIVDVRTEAEFNTGHLRGALNIPHDRIAGLIESRIPDHSTPVLLYCRSGRRSGIALEALRDAGYTRLTNAGGYDSLLSVFGAGR